MSVSKDEYSAMVKKASPGSPVMMDCVKAFLFGGGICAFAQGLTMALNMKLSLDNSKAVTTVVLIVITAILTGFGVFDKIAKHAGAGTAVPITGFANSIVSASLEFQTEGRIMGTAAKMFTIAGPVIVYGCSAASIYGLIVYFFSLY